MLRSLLLCSLLGVVAAQDDGFDSIALRPHGNSRRRIDVASVQVHRHCSDCGCSARCWLLLGRYDTFRSLSSLLHDQKGVAEATSRCATKARKLNPRILWKL